jgi:hypothetical protein
MHPGWFCTGTKKDVPKHAPYVGCYHEAYAWVKPGGEKNLTLVTLAILDLANAVPGSATASTHVDLDKSAASAKKYQDQAQAIVSILKDAPKPYAASVNQLQSILEDKIIVGLNDELSKQKPRLATLSVRPGFEVSSQESGEVGESAPVIRDRPSLVPFSMPPVVIPQPP